MTTPIQALVGQERPITILSTSIDPNLNHARALLLRHHGFEVVTSESREAAHRHIESSSFDVLIFGTTLPRDTCWELAGVFRKRNAQGKVIEIVAAPWSSPKNNPDAIVVSTDDPANLIAAIRAHVS